jgi:DHA1 family inner membrane transport protein
MPDVFRRAKWTDFNFSAGLDVSLTVGNWLGGRFADRSTGRTLITTFVLIAAALSLLAVSMSSLTIATAAIVLWGGATFASTSPLQLRVMTAAAQLLRRRSTAGLTVSRIGPTYPDTDTNNRIRDS